jgi:DNA-binding phage protein
MVANRRKNCHSTVGLLFPIERGRGLSMVLTRAHLCTQLYKTHLRHGKLELQSPCPLPEEVVRALGLKISALREGVYPVLEAEGFLRIDFSTTSTKY